MLSATALVACGGGNDDASTRPAGDPLVQYQWHLKNTGQSTFSARGGVPGIDLDVASVFDQGETGDGVRVLVLDDGLDIRHPDLVDRIAPDMLYNFDPTAPVTQDPTPTNDDSHGSAVAGIIGATANNGVGGRGVAPGVRLGGARLICSQSGSAKCDTPVNMLNAFGGAPFSQGADIINGSFGDVSAAVRDFDPDTSLDGVVMQHLEALRSGKGLVFVKAAGNQFDNLLRESCASAARAGVACGNAALDPMNTMPQALVVGAVNADGVKSSYSSSGSALLVAGLGGEFGSVTGPAIMTTDLSGCNRGSVKTGESAWNPFDDPVTAIARSLNPDCNYMASMNGTSSAAPTVSGVIALMLHANPRLTWRDVRTILATTSRRIDAARVAKTVTLPDGQPYVPEPAWTRNGAGRWFDNWYGFGLVDAAAAVSAARSYSTYLTGSMKRAVAVEASASCLAQPDPDTCGDSIAAGTASGLAVPIQVSAQGIGSIEALQLTVRLARVSMRDMAVELTSPAGTRSVLFNAFNGVRPGVSDVESLTLSSNAFNGESAQGVWTLKFIDVAQRDNPESGAFQAAKINVMGH